jgi:hypothetical protein
MYAFPMSMPRRTYFPNEDRELGAQRVLSVAPIVVRQSGQAVLPP